MAVSAAGAVSVSSPEPPGALSGPGPDEARAPEEELPALDAAEVRSRLERSARQFRNRRKVLIRGLPADVTNQVRAVTGAQGRLLGWTWVGGQLGGCQGSGGWGCGAVWGRGVTIRHGGEQVQG